MIGSSGDAGKKTLFISLLVVSHAGGVGLLLHRPVAVDSCNNNTRGG